MDVCFSIGSNSKRIANMLEKMADNIKFYYYDSVKDIIKDAKLRHLEFDRVVISKSILSRLNPGKDFELLNSFIKEFGANTEIVLLVDPASEKALVKPFKKYFDAPMYTPALVEKANTRVMLDLVSSDILAVKTKYYSLDSSLKKSDIESNDENDVQAAETGAQNDTNASAGFGTNMSTPYASIRGTGHSNLNTSNQDSIKNSEFSGEGSSLVPDEDDLLSLSEEGSLHTDTGFLDEEDEEDIKNASMNNESSEPMAAEKDRPVDLEAEEEVPVNPVTPSKSDNSVLADSPSIVRKGVVDKKRVVKQISERYKKEKVIGTGLNIDLVVSGNGCRCTQDMIDEALSLYQKDEARILIIDLDTKNNRVLTLLNTGNFYANNCQEGITKQRIYVEDHVGICSNGFGVPVSTKDVKALLASKTASKFDLIFIDCPVDCLNIFDEELVRMCNVLIFTGGTMSHLAELTKGLTNRAVVRLSVEKYLMRNCDVEVKGELVKHDLEFLRDNCLFANGCWFDNI